MPHSGQKPCARLVPLVPFNVREIGGDVYVIYAPVGRANQINAPLGAVELREVPAGQFAVRT